MEAYKALNQEYVDEAQMDMSEFLKSQGITEEEYEEECRQYAEALSLIHICGSHWNGGYY